MAGSDSLRDFAFLSTASIPCASSIGFFKVRSASDSRRLCTLSLRIPQTRRPRSVLSRNSAKSQCADNRRNSATYSAIDSVAVWFQQ